MAYLSTTWLGQKLSSPLVLAACGLSSTPDGVRKAADGGFGAVVLKSLFEEQLKAEIASIESSLDSAHSEAAEFLGRMGMEEGIDEYSELVRESSKAGIPVIASINCVSEAQWGDFAERIAEAGAVAIELNAGFLPSSPEEDPRSVEERLFSLVATAKSRTGLPLAVKLGSSWTSLAALAARLSKIGADSLVLFNRFYSLDIDLASMKPVPGHIRSSGGEYHDSLRWISILYDRVPCQFAASSGVHDADAALKLVASGAQVVQICSVVYKKGYQVAGDMNASMAARLDSLGIASIDELRGRFAQWKAPDPSAYQRLQYIKALTGIS